MDSMNCFNEDASDSSSKLPSSRYKGVVPQPNGRWGAQIYEKHQRVWLGTFIGEEEAAKAYDIASLRFRGLDALTNFKQSSLSITEDDQEDETFFLQSHSKAEIVDMLRKHSYSNELELFKHNNGGKRIKHSDIDLMNIHIQKEWLFEKVLTPSDVGRLNRFVIPKQQAKKHFPLMDSEAKGVLLNFEDDLGNVWRFRYCFWSSSQSYVLTKGWTRFVKEKKVKAGDVVRFHRFHGSSSTGADKKLFIECTPRNVDNEVSGFPEMPSPVHEPFMAPVQDHDGVCLTLNKDSLTSQYYITKEARKTSNHAISIPPISTTLGEVTITQSGTFHFACSFGQHFASGQKFAISFASTPLPPSPSNPCLSESAAADQSKQSRKFKFVTGKMGN